MSLPLKLLPGDTLVPANPPRPRVLALVGGGDLIIAPHTQYPAIINVGNGTTFGRIFDRSRGCTVVEMEDVVIIKLLARLVACCLGEGYLTAPPGVQRVGVRYQGGLNIFGCFSLDGNGHEVGQLVTVSIDHNIGLAVPRGWDSRMLTRGNSPVQAMIGAVAVFMGHAAAA